MIKHKMYDNMLNKYETDTNTDEKIITVNKSKLIDDISTLIEVAFIIGVSIGATIMLLISLLVNFSQ